MENTMDKKVINGKTYKAAKGGKGCCGGCVAHESGDDLLCRELGNECTEERNAELVWVLEVD